MCGQLGRLLCHGSGGRGEDQREKQKFRRARFKGQRFRFQQLRTHWLQRVCISRPGPGPLPTPQLCPYLQEGPGVLGPGVGMGAQPRALGLWLQTAP